MIVQKFKVHEIVKLKEMVKKLRKIEKVFYINLNLKIILVLAMKMMMMIKG